MKRFKNILLVLREKHNQRGIERAVALAKKNDAQLTLIQPPPKQLASILSTFKDMGSFGQFSETILDKQREDINKLCASLDVEKVTGIVIESGSQSEEIIKQVLRGNHDLVITTAQGDANSMGGLLRSLSHHLIRKCPCPVWVIHPEKQTQGGHILAAVGSEATESGNRVNSLIVELALSLAQINQSKLHIVQTYYWLELEGYQALLNEYGLDVPRELYEECVAKSVDQRKQKLDALLQNHPLDKVEHEIHLVEGSPSRRIPEFAEKLEVDVLVLGVVTHSGPSGHFIGETAEDIVHKIDCSVLAVKPSDFVSPVEI